MTALYFVFQPILANPSLSFGDRRRAGRFKAIKGIRLPEAIVNRKEHYPTLFVAKYNIPDIHFILKKKFIL